MPIILVTPQQVVANDLICTDHGVPEARVLDAPVARPGFIHLTCKDLSNGAVHGRDLAAADADDVVFVQREVLVW